MESYHRGLHDLNKKSGVTTFVTASSKDYDDLELERINTMPPNVVAVETTTVYKREGEDGTPHTDRSEREGGDLSVQRLGMGGSEVDLFQREQC